MQIASVLPFSLTERSGVPEADVPLWLSISLAVFGTSMLLSAPIASWVVRASQICQVPFVVGLSCAFCSTLLFMLCSAPWLIIIARVFQGFSAGVVYTAGLTLLFNNIEEEELAPWIGFGLSGMNFGVLISPALGGLTYEKLGVYPVFVTGLCVVVTNLAVILLVIDNNAAAQYKPRIVPHDVLSSPSKTSSSTNNTLSSTPTSQSQDPTDTTPLLTTQREHVTTNKTKSIWSSRVRSLLGNPRISTALYGCFLNAILVGSMDTVLPIFVKRTFGWTSGPTGATFLNITIPSLLGPFIGMFTKAYGVRFTATLGLTLTVPALGISMLAQHEDIWSKVILCLSLFVTGKSGFSRMTLQITSIFFQIPSSYFPLGVGINTFLTPLATEIFLAVATLQDEFPETYRGTDTFVDGYMLFDAVLGAGTVVGPLVSEMTIAMFGWWIGSSLLLAGLCLSGAIPVVSSLTPVC